MIDPKYYLQTLEPPKYKPGTLLSDVEALKYIGRILEKRFSSLNQASRYYGMRRGYFSRVLKGQQVLTPEIAEDLGLERWTGWEIL